jgi:hypothetical protein
MSWHFSQALVAEFSVDTSSDGGAFAPSNTTTMPEAFSSHGRTTDASRRSRYGMTFAPLTDALGEAVLTWFLEASRARTSAPQARVQVSADHDPDCGPRWRGLSVRFNQDTSGWRTVRCLLEEDLDWSSLTLPRWGSLHDGELWERTTQEPRTSATGSGCWPTPCASEARQGYQNRNNGKKGSQESLTTVVQGGPSDQVGGSLNPTWVEWLMGWPLGWTDCGASATDRFREWCSAHGMS